jgi:hypothetical protein
LLDLVHVSVIFSLSTEQQWLLGAARPRKEIDRQTVEEGERERDVERGRGRGRHRETERERQRERDRVFEGDRERERERESEREICSEGIRTRIADESSSTVENGQTVFRQMKQKNKDERQR